MEIPFDYILISIMINLKNRGIFSLFFNSKEIIYYLVFG